MLGSNLSLSAHDLVANLYDEVENFAGNEAYSDDRTCVLIRW